MLVYGDDQKKVPTYEFLTQIRQKAASIDDHEPGLAWHGVCVHLFVDLASLLQGIADREFEAQGHDESSPLQDSLMAALRRLAEVIARSWQSGFSDQVQADLGADLMLEDDALPETVTLKRCEGYAFYGVYPEAFVHAARDLPPGCIVIGLRSIGTGLAALVAATSDAELTITLRPTGDPFSRTVRVGPELERMVRERAHKHFVIVDEGPGLSGSSFGGVADWLESLGIARHGIIFMPSHAGDPGAEAKLEHRHRWNNADRRVTSFDDLFLSGAPARLPAWFHDITGHLVEEPADLSGGEWSRVSALPTSPGREARKYLLHGKNGKFLLKVAGLDSIAQAKFGRAAALHRAGFCPEPLAMRYGFLIERYIEGEPARDVPTSLIADYCRFRCDRFPASRQGATLDELVRMASYNIGKAFPAYDPSSAESWSGNLVAKLQAMVEPVHVDGRMHRWEWLRSGSQVFKTDAVDHSMGHDLVGCQDIMWDVAGAIVELGPSRGVEPDLVREFCDRRPLGRELLEVMTYCYIGFQIGWWSFSGTDAGMAHAQSYGRRLPALLAA